MAKLSIFSSTSLANKEDLLADIDKFIRRVFTKLEEENSNLFVIFLPPNRFSCEVITPSNERYSLPLSRIVLPIFYDLYDNPSKHIDDKIIDNIKITLTNLCEEALQKGSYAYIFYGGDLDFNRVIYPHNYPHKNSEVFNMGLNLTVHSI